MPFLKNSKNRSFQNYFNSEFVDGQNIKMERYVASRLFNNRYTGIFIKRYFEGFINLTHHTILQIRDKYNFAKSSSENPRQHY